MSVHSWECVDRADPLGVVGGGMAGVTAEGFLYLPVALSICCSVVSTAYKGGRGGRAVGRCANGVARQWQLYPGNPLALLCWLTAQSMQRSIHSLGVELLFRGWI